MTSTVKTMHDGTNIDLSCINRFNDATRRPYSVGEHIYRGNEDYIQSRTFESARSFPWHDAHESLAF